MNIYSHFKSLLFEIFLEVTKLKIENINALNERFTVELPRDENHGDISTNLCLVFSKNAEMKPRELASLMKPLVEKLDSIISVSIEGPGFLNLKLENYNSLSWESN